MREALAKTRLACEVLSCMPCRTGESVKDDFLVRYSQQTVIWEQHIPPNESAVYRFLGYLGKDKVVEVVVKP